MTPYRPFVYQAPPPSGEAGSAKQARSRNEPDVSNLSASIPADVRNAVQQIADYIGAVPPAPGRDTTRTRQSVESLVVALNAASA